MFELRLSHSGDAVHVAFGSEGQEAFLEGHVIAFARLGGVPARIRYDNARALVARVLRGRDRIETERFIALRSHYGFDSFYCEPGERGAHEKGGIEGEVGRLRRRFFVPDPEGESLAELNARLEEADRRDLARHIGGRRQTVGAMGEADRAALRAAARGALRLRAGRARSGSTARPGSASASASTRCRRGTPGGPLTARIGGTRIEVADGGTVVARHERSPSAAPRPCSSTTTSRSSSRKPGAMPGALATAQAREAGVLTAAHEAFWARARRKFGDAAARGP